MLWKVFAVLASLQAVAPSATSALFTSLYNATAELSYPWQAAFFFASVGFGLIGCVIAILVFISLGFKQIESCEEEDDGKEEISEKGQTSNFQPDDRVSKHSELKCGEFD